MKISKVFKITWKLKLVMFFLTLLSLFVFSKQNFSSVKESTSIFFTSVFPALFPFIFFTEFILNTSIIGSLTKIFGPFFSKLFKISKNATPSILIGFLCGFPMGAKSVSLAYEKNHISYKEASRLLLFINNCNGSFILSTIGIGMFCNIKIGIILFVSHYLCAIIIGIMSKHTTDLSIIPKNGKNINSFDKNCIKKSNLNNNLDNTYISNNIKHTEIELTFFENVRNSVKNTFVNLSFIFGYIIIFNLVFNYIRNFLECLNVSENIVYVLSGVFEITNGAKNISLSTFDINIQIILVAFILGFSGICILFQVYSTVCKYRFPFLKIVKYKLIHGILSAVVTYILLIFVKVEKTPVSVFSNIALDSKLSYSDYLNAIKTCYLNQTLIIVSILCIYQIISILRRQYISKKNEHKKR